MRIAYVCADPAVPVYGSGGPSVHVQEVVRELVRRGATVQVFCVSAGGPPPPDLRNVIVHEIGVPPGRRIGTGQVRHELELLAANATLTTLMGAQGPFDLVYERYSLWSRAAMSFAWSSAIPSVLEINAPLVDDPSAPDRTLPQDGRGRDPLVHRAAALQVLNSVLAEADSIVCVSEPIAEWVRSHSPRQAGIHVIPNGVDLARITPAAEPAGSFTVGFLGRLIPSNGVEFLVRAAAQVEDLRVLIVGDGPERCRLGGLVASLGISHRVDFTGEIAPIAVAEQLNRMHVAVAPFPAVEGFCSPLKVFEYLAAGLPLVASRHGQLVELLTHCEDALLVPPGDVAAVAHAVCELRDDDGLRSRLRAAARATATGHSWASTVDRILDTVAIRMISANLRPALVRQRVS